MEFALLLTRLKERTDRSYAALGRRLGMNASTLHRYCSGEAVPLDFTGLERFAALCGASPEERVELHRRWILAVAARRRSRLSDARRAATRHDTASPAPSSAPVGHGDRADEAPEQTMPAGPGPAFPADRPAPARRPRRRPVRSMVLAASLALAFAGLTTSAAGPPFEGGGPSASARTAPKPSAPAAPGGGSPQSEAPPPAPLTWTTDSQLWQLDCDHDYVIAKPPEQVPPPPTPADAAVWAASQKAVHGQTTNLRISVQGRGLAAVVLEALHVRVVDRVTPADRSGSAYSMYEGCGAVLVPRYFAVDLDARRPLARSKPGNDPDRPAPAIGFPYQVSLRDPEVLLLAARTESCTCDWYLDLDWSSQGRSGTVRIDDHGRPFRTTSVKGLPHYWYRDLRGWVPMT
ncbi:helix-turn-helix transcriptional regulator [Streptomyces sp. AK04-3B]|uniref:helix-turn-helix domain-containing protein n=1 Tax=Streptomyces sp. AK04-3B TaxID=3028650 RepID=UPI0029BFBF4D|nr:helix-turn-helix transcriptional regulator [Streptomyces sp. AK04-3B]